MTSRHLLVVFSSLKLIHACMSENIILIIVIFWLFVKENFYFFVRYNEPCADEYQKNCWELAHKQSFWYEDAYGECRDSKQLVASLSAWLICSISMRRYAKISLSTVIHSLSTHNPHVIHRMWITCG